MLVGGCFDPLHEGHLEYFRQARQYGPLVCAVMPDAAMTKRTSCLPEMTRLKVLNACSLVEHVHLAVQGIAAVIRALKPTHYVIGREYAAKDPRAGWRVPSEDVRACGESGTQMTCLDCRERSSTELLADYMRRDNAEKLAQFETWVQGQKPADKPWEPVTDYSLEARKAIEGPHAELIRDVFHPAHVLDVGAGPGHFARLLVEAGLTVTPIDPSGDRGENVNLGDIVDLAGSSYRSWYLRKYDLVICREVLEHLTVQQLAVAVRNLVKLSSRFIYLTTRFTPKPHLLDYDERDDLDPTHCTMLNQDFLRTLFVLEGCTRRADLEQRMDWQGKNRVLVYQVPQ